MSSFTKILSIFSESIATASPARVSDSREAVTFGSSVENSARGSFDTAPRKTSSVVIRWRGGAMRPATSSISASPRMVLATRGVSSR